MSLESLSPAQQDWYRQAIRNFRALGFFAHYAGLSEEECIAKIAARVALEWDTPLPVDPTREPQAADMALLAADAGRVWRRDLECISPGADAYAEILREWAAISRGALQPEEITETWRSDDGPVELEFTFHGQRHRFVHEDGRDDFLNPGLRHLLNRLIEPSGYRFEVCDALGMPDFVVVLTEKERGRLEQERGWKFDDI